MKRFEITYNPYSNEIHFRQALGKEGSEDYEWTEIESDSSFLKFQKQRCIFESCAEEILDCINKYINTSGELIIDFNGTDEDFGVLQLTVKKDKDPKSKGITCEINERYPSASDVLNKIRDSYDQIKSEFDDYIDNDRLNEEDERRIIGNAVSKFQETVRAEIPVCVIGNYSVGKSALVNALIGLEILPSHANSTTAKNVLVKNDNSFCLCFDCENVKYKVTIQKNGNDIECSGKVDDELISELFNGTEKLDSEEKILHQIIENLNTEASLESRIAKIDSKVSISVPFRKSELDTEKYEFVFIDTPGSNNGDEAQKIHRENLEELMSEQTNALPIFVMSRNSIDSNDANDLRTLLESKEAGFALQNCIIAISMSDQLVEQQLSEEMPDKVKQWLSHPTIMYVSPIAAIGEKKADKRKWIDKAYKQIYEKKMGDITEVNPPNYNETPCGRKMNTARIKAISPMLYASGLPSLETEINYFAYRFAEYKKCTNGRTYLLTALQKADEKLLEAKEKLENDKQEKIKEQDAVRASIKKKIEDVKLPTVNSVIAPVSKDFTKALEDYCKDVEPVARAIWNRCKNDKDAFNIFEKQMAKHCQENLYDKQIKQIKRKIESKFIELTATYMSNVKKCVTDEYGKFSKQAKKELDEVFHKNESGPKLKDVSVGVFERIGYFILAKLPFEKAQDRFIRNYSKKFVEKLKGTDKTYGIFVQQCIAQPAKKYSEQIVAWSNDYKASIGKTLNQDNAILSALDEKIKTMEDMILDMEKRLKNLSGVRNTLLNSIPKTMEEKKNG